MQGNFRTPMQVNRPGMAIIDLDGNLVDMNQRFYWLMDAPENDEASHLGELIDYEQNPELGEGMEKLSSSNCPESICLELSVSNRSQASKLSAQLIRLPNNVGRIDGKLLLMLEESAAREGPEDPRRRNLQRAIRSRFDHDLRSRLNVILGYCSMLMEDLSEREDASELTEDLKCVLTAGNELLALNEKNADLLNLIDGSWETAREEILPANIVADVVKNIRSRFPEHEFRIEADDHTVDTDGEMLAKLLDSMLFKLCQEVISGARIKTSGNLEEATGRYIVNIACTPDPKVPQNKEKLRNLVDRMTARTPNDSRVPNLDFFYLDTLGNLLDASVKAFFDDASGRGGYEIVLPASSDYDG